MALQRAYARTDDAGNSLARGKIASRKKLLDRGAQVIAAALQTQVAATENPFLYDECASGDSLYNNLRFPGQYFDAETGKHYNYKRDYDPSIGRYIESDSIGLYGGLNTFAYVEGKPLTNVDPTGLAPWLCFRAVENLNVGNHSYFWDDKSNKCCARTPGKDPLKGCKEGGPSKDTCFKLSNNDDDSGKLFSCCDRRAREGYYFPGANDCQSTTNDCMKENNIVPPPNPGRSGKCPSCWSK